MMMCHKIRAFWNSLDKRITVNKRELFLGMTCCTLAGILTGMLLSPKKTATIGSNNGNNNTGNSAGSAPAKDDDAAAEEEA